MARAGGHHPLVGIGDDVAVHCVEGLGCGKWVERLGQFARDIDPHRHDLAHRGLAGPLAFAFGKLEVGQAEGAVRGALRIGGRQQIGHRAKAEIQPGTLDRRVDHGQLVDALVAQRRYHGR